jgi:lipoprotein-anchoring transpeptidase ErfK/SrfK
MKNTHAVATAIVLSSLIFSGCRRAPAPQIARGPTSLAEAQPPKPGPGPRAPGFAPIVELEPVMLPGPNAVPGDTRVVVNIPAYRMDVFKDGALIRSYRIGIGYPQFPLPTGLRKAQLIILNPTWTPPDSSWVTSMNVTPGEVVGAGSARNPLGPIKIPIGMPSLIHGGKPSAKIGTFASHGCVGLTDMQVRDFALALVQATETDLPDRTMSAYLIKRTKTRVVKLNKLVPVELRYETIVVEDGKLHIHRDVYGQGTNTEENLRTVLAAQGVNLDDLSGEEKAQVLDALNAMSNNRRKTSPTFIHSVAKSPASNTGGAPEGKKAGNAQKKVVIEIAGLNGKGYPVPLNLDVGTGTAVKSPL